MVFIYGSLFVCFSGFRPNQVVTSLISSVLVLIPQQFDNFGKEMHESLSQSLSLRSICRTAITIIVYIVFIF